MRVNSSGVRLCFWTNSGVIAGSIIEQVGFRQRKRPQRIPRGRHEPTKRPPQRELFLENSGAGEGRFSDSFHDLATAHWGRERWGSTESRPTWFKENPLSFFACIGTVNYPLTRPPATLSPFEWGEGRGEGRFKERPRFKTAAVRNHVPPNADISYSA